VFRRLFPQFLASLLLKDHSIEIVRAVCDKVGLSQEL
jgi:hypothetical protein